MAVELILAEEVRAYLIDGGLVSAGEDNVTQPPPCFTDPRDGAMDVELPPGADAVVTIITGKGITNPFLEARFLQDFPLEFIVRAKRRPQCNLIQRGIAGLMLEKENILMGRLLIERSSHFREEQTIAQSKDSWATSQSFRVSYRRASLTV